MTDAAAPHQNAVPPVSRVDAPDGEVWTITLTSIGPGPSTCIRIRRALKHLLRAHRLRALSVTGAPPAAPASPASPPVTEAQP